MAAARKNDGGKKVRSASAPPLPPPPADLPFFFFFFFVFFLFLFSSSSLPRFAFVLPLDLPLDLCLSPVPLFLPLADVPFRLLLVLPRRLPAAPREDAGGAQEPDAHHHEADGWDNAPHA